MLRYAALLAAKDLRLFLADRRALALTFLLPIALISIFYFAFGGSPEDGNRPVLSLVLLDLDDSPDSRAMIAELDSITGLRLDRVNTEEAARDAVVRGKRAAALIFHPAWGDSLQRGGTLPTELVYDSGRSMEYGMLTQILFSAFSEQTGERQGRARARRQMVEQLGLSPEAADGLLGQMEGGSGPAPAAPFRSTEVLAQRDNDFNLIQAVAGTAVMLLLFSVAGMGSGLLAERETGTLKKLLYAPMPASAILMGKFLATLSIATAQLLLMFAFAALAFGLDLGRNLPALLLMIAATASVCAALGMLLASVVQSRKQLDGLSTILILTMSAIGGSMMPVVFMPMFLQKMAVGTVNYWAIQGFYDIYWRNLPLSEVLDNAAVLLGLSTLLLGLAVWFFRRNLLRLL